MTQNLEKTTEVQVYVRTLRQEQERVILAGRFTRIEEYRAACAVVRNLDRIAEVCDRIMEGSTAEAELADEALTPMEETESG